MSKKFPKRNLFVKNAKSNPLSNLLIWVIAFIGLVYGIVFLWPVVPSQANTPDLHAYKVKIQAQSSLMSIGEQLAQQGIQTYPLGFFIGARALFVGSKLKPGTYLFLPNASLGQVLLQIARGDRVRETIAIIPGMTIWQLRALVDAHPALIHKTAGMSSKELLAQLNLSYPGDEGLFFPDTYVFDPDELDIAIYLRASQAMQKQLAQAWAQKGAESPLKTPYQLLILSSIVEKETGKAGDRDMVAAVFINRLNRGMPLQTDPTIIYGIGPHFDGDIRKSDLRKDSPYNTYMHKGLPPTPIAMPSRESLLAAVHPANSGALYFVARGDGSSHFSSTLNEHEQAVDLYQRKPSTKTHSSKSSN